MAEIYLKPGREKSVLHRHPWIFSSAIDKISGTAGSGDTVEIFSAKKEWLCRAAYSPKSNIRARVWTWNAAEQVDRAFFAQRLQAAAQLRRALIKPGETEMFRLVNAESDSLPGLVIDVYAGTAVMQLQTAGVEKFRNLIAELLCDELGFTALYERSDLDVRALEGLTDRTGAVCGVIPRQPMTVMEDSLRFLVDIEQGHKTGFYLDQRLNRRLFREQAAGREILNCFSYTGAFSAYALDGQAERVTSIDSSADALATAQANMELNGFSSSKCDYIEGDVFKVLRTFRDQGRDFDLILLDPPKFAPTSAQVQRATRGYKDINLLAFKLLRPKGVLVTFSCSGGISPDLFQKIVASAALDAGVNASITHHLYQSPDHPVSIHFPEGLYLKGLVCRLC